MSAELMENNGKKSTGKRTRRMNIRYFFIKDVLDRQDLKIRTEHCPTDDMYGDYFSKPLQGSLFYKFRNKIMNMKD